MTATERKARELGFEQMPDGKWHVAGHGPTSEANGTDWKWDSAEGCIRYARLCKPKPTETAESQGFTIGGWYNTTPKPAPIEYPTEPTPIGNQYVIPGCEKDKTRGPVQPDLF